MKINEFKTMYSGLKDAGCNQDALYPYFQKLTVSNPIKKCLHNFSKKDGIKATKKTAAIIGSSLFNVMFTLR